MKTPQPKLLTMTPPLPQSAEPERNMKRIEELRLLRRIIAEAKLFRRQKPSATAPALPARSGTSSDFQRHQQ